MAITDAGAVQYINERIRPAADRLARCFYRAQKISDRWNSISGTNAEKLALMSSSLASAADLFWRTRNFIFEADRIWTVAGMSALIPNDNTELVFDNGDNSAQDPSRPPINGQDVRRVKQQMEEFVNWLQRGTDLDKHFLTDAAPPTLPITYDYLDNVGRIINANPADPTAGQANTFVDRCDDLVTQYETTSPADLTRVLVVAVNPNDNEEV